VSMKRLPLIISMSHGRLPCICNTAAIDVIHGVVCTADVKSCGTCSVCPTTRWHLYIYDSAYSRPQADSIHIGMRKPTRSANGRCFHALIATAAGCRWPVAMAVLLHPFTGPDRRAKAVLPVCFCSCRNVLFPNSNGRTCIRYTSNPNHENLDWACLAQSASVMTAGQPARSQA
jgi:hypothetical protein